MQKFLVTMTTLAVLTWGSAHAALLIEPVVGYNFGSLTNSATDFDESATGVGYGARLGFQQLGFQLGLDYLSSNLDVDSLDDNLKTTEFGAFIGYRLPVFLRVYAGYIFSGTGELGNTDYEDGTGTKLGLGFTGIPFIDLNLEYRSVAYDKAKSGSISVDTETEYDVIMLSVSLPITI